MQLKARCVILDAPAPIEMTTAALRCSFSSIGGNTEITAMMKHLYWYTSITLGVIAVILGVVLLRGTFLPYSTSVLGFYNGVLLVAGIGILDERWRTRQRRKAVADKRSKEVGQLSPAAQ